MIAASISFRSRRSSAKVRSFDTLLGCSVSAARATRERSSPAARSTMRGPATPNADAAAERSSLESCPRVRIPICPRRAWVALPTPLMAETGNGARNARSVPGRTAVRPRGFSRSDAIFATVLFTPMPIEQVMPSSATRAWTRRQMSTGLSLL